MKTNEIMQASLLDLLFENRNKQYGAYELRKNYGLRLKKAVFSTVSLVTLFFVVLSSFKKEEKLVNPAIPIIEQFITRPETIIPDKPKPVEKPKGKPADQMRKNPLISANLQLVDYTPELANYDLPSNPNGNENIGDGPIEPIGAIDGTDIPMDTLVAEPVKVIVAPQIVVNQIIETPDEDATYPGGRFAMGDYLQSKLGDEAIEDNEPKKITISFIIEKDGTVSNVKAADQKDVDFAKKAIKAFEKMKKWRPARFHGDYVRTFREIPVIILPQE